MSQIKLKYVTAHINENDDDDDSHSYFHFRLTRNTLVSSSVNKTSPENFSLLTVVCFGNPGMQKNKLKKKILKTQYSHVFYWKKEDAIAIMFL